MSVLTQNQAYLAMFEFLTRYWARSRSDEIAALLGAMSLLPDGQPADPAFSANWDEAVRLALSGAVNAGLEMANPRR